MNSVIGAVLGLTLGAGVGFLVVAAFPAATTSSLGLLFLILSPIVGAVLGLLAGRVFEAAKSSPK